MHMELAGSARSNRSHRIIEQMGWNGPQRPSRRDDKVGLPASNRLIYSARKKKINKLEGGGREGFL